jgi:hypothetical protein
MATAQITHETDRERQMLVARAESLRAQAAMLPAVLAGTYRRRASELELEAWVLEVRSSSDEVAVPA